MLMDIATEEFSHLEIVGATITMLLDGVNGELRQAAEQSEIMQLLNGKEAKESLIHAAMPDPTALVLTGGGPNLTNSHGVPWNGYYVNANGDLSVDLRSNIAAESRAKIVYEYLLHYTDDPLVHESLRFLMTREVAHFQMFSALLESIQPNFPPAVAQADPRFSHTYFNMSSGGTARGPWNQGQGPWPAGEQWQYIEDPIAHVLQTQGLQKHDNGGATKATVAGNMALEKELGNMRSAEVKSAVPKGANQWNPYPVPPTAPLKAANNPPPMSRPDAKSGNGSDGISGKPGPRGAATQK
jgi:Mn-containing catalase